MGCDIHLYVEKRRFKYNDEKRENGVWVSADKWTVDEYNAIYPEDGGTRRLIVDYKDRVYDSRNYDVFAILADVRNGRGFAGCDTGDGFEPIAMPKGLPDDLSPEVKAEAEFWEGDGHSHSWLTLQELMDYAKKLKTMKTMKRGVVSVNEYKKFKEIGQPDSWSGGVGGGMVVNVTNDKMDKIIEGKYPLEEGKSYYTQIEWEVNYKQWFNWFFTDIIRKLKKLIDRKDITPDDIRIVFWFDN